MKITQMNLTIKEQVDLDTGKFSYVYEMYDGPDGIEEFRGIASSLEECFKIILQEREIVRLEYL